jgi:hypothetical protein
MRKFRQEIQPCKYQDISLTSGNSHTSASYYIISKSYTTYSNDLREEWERQYLLLWDLKIKGFSAESQIQMFNRVGGNLAKP